MPRPDLDSIQGLSPSIALKQGSIFTAGRTLGSFTEISQLLAVIFSRQGKAYCPSCGAALKASTVQAIVDEISSFSAETKLEIMAPTILANLESLIKLRESGLVRVKIEGTDYRLDERLEDIPFGFGFIVFDRLGVGNSSRIFDSVESAYKLGFGKVAILVNQQQLLNFQETATCNACEVTIPEIKPQLFSFNHPHGACKLCNGEGSELCEECHGFRLRKESNWIRLGELNFRDFSSVLIEQLAGILNTLELKAESNLIKKQILDRIELICNLGLGYLNLSKNLEVLSSGEIQRLRLANQFAAGLSGLIYVLDEPSAHLDRFDVSKVLKQLIKLKNAGNTVIVVDHHPDLIEVADYLVEMGPGAGELGGQVTFQGTVKEVLSHKESLTSKYHSSKRSIIESGRKFESSKMLEFDLPTLLKNKSSFSLPANSLVSICGRSGSGKTRLLVDGIIPALTNLNPDFKYQGPTFYKIVNLLQGNSSKTLRSNPASLLEVFSTIRELFSGMAESRIRGFTASRFSFNVKGGRCEDCLGVGVTKVELALLSDVYVICDTCNGKKYNKDILSVKYRGLNICEVLDLSLIEAANFFKQVPNVFPKLNIACEVGLSYLRLGQPANSISGGEFQRLKVAQALQGTYKGQTLFVLDEPCLGLHACDVELLIKLLQRLVNDGNSVLLITQNLDLVCASDCIVKLESGEIDYIGKPSGCDFLTLC